MEEWKDIKGFDGYQVSSFGRVRTHNKITHTAKHGDRHWKDRILKFKKEYYSSKNKKQGMGNRVDLWKDGKPYTFLVHRLVATTFLEDLIDTDMTVNHKDGNRYNNNVNNLEWLSRAENIKYGFINNQFPQKEVTIINIKTGECKTFRSLSHACRHYGKHHGFISDLLKKNKHFFEIDGISYYVS